MNQNTSRDFAIYQSQYTSIIVVIIVVLGYKVMRIFDIYEYFRDLVRISYKQLICNFIKYILQIKYSYDTDEFLNFLITLKILTIRLNFTLMKYLTLSHIIEID